jgi:hypothetical protein
LIVDAVNRAKDVPIHFKQPLQRVKKYKNKNMS